MIQTKQLQEAVQVLEGAISIFKDLGNARRTVDTSLLLIGVYTTRTCAASRKASLVRLQDCLLLGLNPSSHNIYLVTHTISQYGLPELATQS